MFFVPDILLFSLLKITDEKHAGEGSSKASAAAESI
jgi:hypothetical protein